MMCLSLRVNSSLTASDQSELFQQNQQESTNDFCSLTLSFLVILLQIVLVYNSSEEQLTAVPGTDLHWLGGVRPPDVPVCGFKNDNPICLASQWSEPVHTVRTFVVQFLLLQ